mgnify:CR=1 FL=1
MHLLTHAALGAALSSGVQDPAVAALMGLVSHAVLDALPHRDAQVSLEFMADVAATMALATLLTSHRTLGLYPVIGAVSGLAPDAEIGLAYLGWFPGAVLFPSHSGLLPHDQTQSWRAVIAEVVLALGLVAYLAKAV